MRSQQGNAVTQKFRGFDSDVDEDLQSRLFGCACSAKLRRSSMGRHHAVSLSTRVRQWVRIVHDCCRRNSDGTRFECFPLQCSVASLFPLFVIARLVLFCFYIFVISDGVFSHFEPSRNRHSMNGEWMHRCQRRAEEALPKPRASQSC